MGKSSPKPPAAPDPAATTAAQAAANKEAIQESARVNAVDINSPYGNVTYTKDADGIPTAQNIALTPQGQSIYNTQQDITGTLSSKARDLAGYLPTDQFSLDGIPGLSSDGDMEALRGRVEQSQFDRAMNLLNPQFERDARSLDDTLYNRGMPMGSGEAYDYETGRLRETQADTRLKAAQDAIALGGQEASRQFGLSQAARQQGIADALTERNQPFNEMSAYLQGSPALGQPAQPGLPQYQVPAADAAGNIWNAYNANYNNYAARQQGGNNLLGGLFSLGSAAIGSPWFGGLF